MDDDYYGIALIAIKAMASDSSADKVDLAGKLKALQDEIDRLLDEFDLRR